MVRIACFLPLDASYGPVSSGVRTYTLLSMPCLCSHHQLPVPGRFRDARSREGAANALNSCAHGVTRLFRGHCPCLAIECSAWPHDSSERLLPFRRVVSNLGTSTRSSLLDASTWTAVVPQARPARIPARQCGLLPLSQLALTSSLLNNSRQADSRRTAVTSPSFSRIQMTSIPEEFPPLQG